MLVTRQVGSPNHEIALVQHLPRRSSGLVDLQNVGVAQQAQRVLIKQREIGADDQRTASHGPKAKLGLLLGGRETRMARSWADVGVWRQLADRQHVRVRPVAGLGILGPLCGVFELILYADGEARIADPNVPDVVGHAPHLGETGHFCVTLHGGRPWRQAQHNVATAVLNRQLDLPNFADLVGMVRNAVHFQEIDTPAGVLTKERVVPCLAGGGVLDSPACRIPGAGVILVGGILSFEE